MNYFLFSLLISYVTGQSLICLKLGAPPSSWVGGQSWGCENEYNYLGNIKNQGTTGSCWSFSTASFLKSQYNILTRNRLMLSTQQIDEDLWEFASSSTDTIVVAQCKNIIDEFPGITGGTQFCALQYIQKNGIMTEHSCPFAFGGLTNCFDKNKITPNSHT